MTEEKAEAPVTQAATSLEAAIAGTAKGEFFSKLNRAKNKLENVSETDIGFTLEDFQTGKTKPVRTSDHTEANTFGQHSEKVILNTLFHGVCCSNLTPHKTWSSFQHYLYYFYRHVVSVKPYNNVDKIPLAITRAISEVFEILQELDTTQISIKMVSLIRDYVLVALNHIENVDDNNDTTFFVTLMSYYSALSSAAGKCAPLLPEFDFMMMGSFDMNWIGVNKSLFYHHVYMSKVVQEKLPIFETMRQENNLNLKGLLESFKGFLQEMKSLETRWEALIIQINSYSKEHARKNPKKNLLRDWRTFSEHTKIFKSHTWINRSLKSAKEQQSPDNLEVHILGWIANQKDIPDPLIDYKGCCLCEECLSAEFRNGTMDRALARSYRSEIPARCVLSCYICSDIITLESLYSHITTQHSGRKASKNHNCTSTHHAHHPPSAPKETPNKDSQKSQDMSLLEGLLEKNEQIKRTLKQFIDGTAPDRHKVVRERKEKEAAAKLRKGKNKVSDAFCELIKAEKQKVVDSANNCETLFPFNSGSKIYPANDNHFKSSKELILKLASEPPVFSGADVEFMEGAKSIEAEKMTTAVDTEETNNKTNPNADTKNDHSEKNCKGSSKASQTSPEVTKFSTTDENLVAAAGESNSFRKPHQKELGSNIDSKVLEFLKTANANAQKVASGSQSDDMCTGHSCSGLKCKQEEELRKMSADCCDHKDSKKCDCGYCDFYGLGSKHSGIRDRLRTRLNQRKMENEMIENGPRVFLNHKVRVVKATPTEPPRVPELHHPVPPPGSTKTSTTATNRGSTSVTVTETTEDEYGRRQSISSFTTCSLLSEAVDCRDIDDLLNYIEGNKTADEAALAHKKAAKKARQRTKKVQEKEERDKLEKERAERQKIKEAKIKEEKLKEEERLKAEAAAAKLEAEKQKKAKKEEKAAANPPKQEAKKNNKKKSNKSENVVKVSGTTKVVGKDKAIEETIPATVTIKRAHEGTHSQSTVTITLQGSTPDTEKVLFQLVGNENKSQEMASAVTKMKGQGYKFTESGVKTVTEIIKPLSKKQEKENAAAAKAIKAAEAQQEKINAKKELALKKPLKMDTFASHQLQQAFNSKYEPEPVQVKPQTNPKEEVTLPMLNLPPGITITKIEGPPDTANCKPNNNPSTSYYNNNHYHNQNINNNVPSTKSGVIVVDTEKLIQQSIAAGICKRDKKMSKKKRDPQATPSLPPPQPPPPKKQPKPQKECVKPADPPTMVTLKNPIFETQPPKKSQEKPSFDNTTSQQASIVKGENGMVTIRSPRLQNPFDTGAPVSSYFSNPQPVFSSNMATPYYPMQPLEQTQQPNYYDSNNSNNKSQFSQYNSHYHAHEFLAGLPGIEITKINREAAAATANENRIIEDPPRIPKPISRPEVVIPTVPNPTNNMVNGSNTFNFDADDWYYENVFKPRQELEEDMDDEEELELAEFKRFCEASFAGIQQQNYGNLNMPDMIYNNSDLSYT